MSRRSNDVILFHNPIALASCISLLNCPVCGCATLYALEGRQVGRWRFVDEVFLRLLMASHVHCRRFRPAQKISS